MKSMRTLLLFFSGLLSASVHGAWLDHGGPAGGEVSALEVIGAEIFAGFVTGGAIRSRDKGVTWQAINNGLPPGAVSDFVEQGGVLFVATSYGVYRSANRGDTWAYAGAVRPNDDFSSLAANDKALFMATSSGVSRSLDQGATWAVSGTGMINASVGAVASMGQVVFAGLAGRGVYRSLDGGDSWAPANQGISGLLNLGNIRIRNDTVEFGCNGNGIHRSVDSGRTWVKIANGSLLPWVKTGGIYYASLTSILTDDGAYRSDDDGKTWSRIWPNLLDTEIHVLAHLDGVFLAGTYGGLYRSGDGGATWAKVEAGLRNASVSSLAVGGSSLFAATLGGMYASPGGSGAYQERNLGLQQTYLVMVRHIGENLFASTLRKGLFRSLDAGLTWSRVATVFDSNYVFDVISHKGKLYAGAEYGVYESVDGGLNWTKPKSQIESYSSLCLAATGDIMLLGTGGHGIWRGSDNTDWSLSNGGLGNYYIRDIFVTDSFALAATGGWGLWRSSDMGRIWERVASTDIRGEVWAIVSAEGRLFAGSQDGIFQSLDGGRTWGQKNEGLPASTQVSSLAVMDSTLYAGTRGEGVWKRSLRDIPLSVRVRKQARAGGGPGKWVKLGAMEPSPVEKGTRAGSAWLDALGRPQGGTLRSGVPGSPGVYFRP